MNAEQKEQEYADDTKIKKRPPQYDMRSKTCTRSVTLNRKFATCPYCGGRAFRHSRGKRTVRELGIPRRQTLIEVHYRKYQCYACHKTHTPDIPWAGRNMHYTHRVVMAVCDLASRMTLEKVTKIMWDMYGVRIPPTTIHDMVVKQYKK